MRRLGLSTHGATRCGFFFFQAEDGIRDLTVTGVQTCALPIAPAGPAPSGHDRGGGFASGFTSAVAGVGGPALAVYAVATRWPQREFAATCQVCYVGQAAAALAIRGLPTVSAASLGATLAAAL